MDIIKHIFRVLYFVYVRKGAKSRNEINMQVVRERKNLFTNSKGTGVLDYYFYFLDRDEKKVAVNCVVEEWKRGKGKVARSLFNRSYAKFRVQIALTRLKDRKTDFCYCANG